MKIVPGETASGMYEVPGSVLTELRELRAEVARWREGYAPELQELEALQADNARLREEQNEARTVVDDLIEMKHNREGELEARVRDLEAALRGMFDRQLLSMPGISPDGTVSATSSMAETLARAALADKEGT